MAAWDAQDLGAGFNALGEGFQNLAGAYSHDLSMEQQRQRFLVRQELARMTQDQKNFLGQKIMNGVTNGEITWDMGQQALGKLGFPVQGLSPELFGNVGQIPQLQNYYGAVDQAQRGLQASPFAQPSAQTPPVQVRPTPPQSISPAPQQTPGVGQPALSVPFNPEPLPRGRTLDPDAAENTVLSEKKDDQGRVIEREIEDNETGAKYRVSVDPETGHSTGIAPGQRVDVESATPEEGATTQTPKSSAELFPEMTIPQAVRLAIASGLRGKRLQNAIDDAPSMVRNFNKQQLQKRKEYEERQALEASAKDDSDPEAEETPDTLRAKARALEGKASTLRLQGTVAAAKEAKEAMKEAKDLRAAAVALRTREQRDTALELAADKARKTQEPLTEDAVRFVVTQALKGNMQAISGFARNQVAKRQIADALPRIAKELGMDPEAANVAVMKFHAANRTETDFAAGQAARNITAINTAIGHMGTMSRLADALQSGNSQTMNAILNQVRTEFGNPSITNFEIAKSAVSDELMRVFRQVGASQTEVEKWESKFAAAQTPQQIREGLNTASSLLHSRINALQEQYQRGTGRASAEILTPEAKQALKEIAGKAVKMQPTPKSMGERQWNEKDQQRLEELERKRGAQ